MSISFVFNQVASIFVLPPFSLVLLCALGLLLRRRFPRLGPGLAAFSLLLLTALSTPVCAKLLARSLEDMAQPLLELRKDQAQAIVILGGGRMSNAPEYGQQDVPSLITLGRMRYGARLQRETGLPLLVTGGSPGGAPQPEATLMAKVLREEFAVPVEWVEAASDNTAENARYSARILQQKGIRRIFLVTDALHMARARRAFERQGLQVVPAPTAFYSRTRDNLLRWLPSAGALELSSYALHEWVGIVWYRLREQAGG